MSIQQFAEIATITPIEIMPEFQSLSSPEKIFLYLFYRASLPLNLVFADQMHRYSNDITETFEFLLNSLENDNQTETALYTEVKTYLIYLWTCHCQYYPREFVNHKRTPSVLGLNNLTPDVLKQALTNYGWMKNIETLLPHIFDQNHEPTLCVTGSIEESASNLYDSDFTTKHYESLPDESRGGINSYYYLEREENIDGSNQTCIPKVRPYGAKQGLQNSRELKISLHWLTQAWKHAQNYPEQFDEHFVKSLDFLIQHIKTGDEQLFKEHSKEWIRSNSRLDYLFGFIECYEDPMTTISMASAEITIKNPNFQNMDDLLRELEDDLPVADEYRRQNKNSTNNCSSNIKLFTAGGNGPLQTLAAYCLPNYDEIRSNYGSKQILYKFGKRLGELLNPELSRALSRTSNIDRQLKTIDQDHKLFGDIWDIQVILHETTGHGSGNFATHQFTRAQTIGGQRYEAGDTVSVNDKNIKEFITDYSSMEEMRAEIHALYLSLASYDKLRTTPLYQKWDTVLGEEEFKKYLIRGMARVGLNRYLYQQENFTEVRGAHSIADIVILNWLLSSGSISIIEETKVIDSQTYQIIGVDVLDYETAFDAVKQLSQKVQEIKSCGLGDEYNTLVNTYTTGPITMQQGNRFRNILHRNQAAILGDLKLAAEIYPLYEPVLDDNGTIVDVTARWPNDMVEEQRRFRELTLSTKY